MEERRDDLCLIVMDNCEALGEKVNRELQNIRNGKDSFITPVKIIKFSDGEGKALICDSIRDKDVYIMCDTHNYSVTYKMYDFEHHLSPDEHFMDVIRVISAMMGHAKSINVVMPLLYESRQHRRKSRESLDCAVALQILERIGVRNIISFDVHDPNIQNAIPLMSLNNFYPTNNTLKEFFKNEQLDLGNVLVVSPDIGAMERAKFLAKILKCDIGVFYKQRDVSKVVNGKNPIVDHKYLGSDVEGKTIIVVDDMLASGGSMLEVAEELKKRKAARIFFFTSFALFTEGYKKFDEAYEAGLFDAIYATNLNYVPDEILSKEWYNSVDCSTYLAEIIDCLNRGESISQLIDDNSAITSFLNGEFDQKSLHMQQKGANPNR